MAESPCSVIAGVELSSGPPANPNHNATLSAFRTRAVISALSTFVAGNSKLLEMISGTEQDDTVEVESHASAAPMPASGTMIVLQMPTGSEPSAH